MGKDIKVTDAKVLTKLGGFTNMAMVDFWIEGEERKFGINFFDKDSQGVVYLAHELQKRGIKDAYDTKEISKQVLEVLKEKGETLENPEE